jgi:hypothetical protein
MVIKVIVYGLDSRVLFLAVAGIFLFASTSFLFWGQPNFLSDGYQKLFLWR